MNIHPLFVHFPIALLTVYAGLEVLRLKRFKLEPSWLYLKAGFLLIGTIGAHLALQTGELGIDLYRGYWQIIEVHESFATLTTTIFSILSVGYVILLAERWYGQKISTYPLLAKVAAINKQIFSSFIAVILAMLGFAALLVTGALGAAIVYGPMADPFVNFVYKLLVKA